MQEAHNSKVSRTETIHFIGHSHDIIATYGQPIMASFDSLEFYNCSQQLPVTKTMIVNRYCIRHIEGVVMIIGLSYDKQPLILWTKIVIIWLLPLMVSYLSRSGKKKLIHMKEHLSELDLMLPLMVIVLLLGMRLEFLLIPLVLLMSHQVLM